METLQEQITKITSEAEKFIGGSIFSRNFQNYTSFRQERNERILIEYQLFFDKTFEIVYMEFLSIH
jgi:hypothetical protein